MVANAIVVAMPRQDIEIVKEQLNVILNIKTAMLHSVHFGEPYPGSKKETLLKPGAEWLQRQFGMRPRFTGLDERVEPNFDDLAKSWVMFRYRCEMIDIETGQVVGEAIGSCNSLEDKYHWRNGSLQCPHCGKETLMISKRNPNAWWCNTYRGGCGNEYSKTDPAIAGQDTSKTIHPNPLDLLNTIDKMAQKRAMVSAVLNATGASAYFAPGDEAVTDLYDTNVIEGDFTEVPEEPGKVESKPAAKSKKDEAPAHWVTDNGNAKHVEEATGMSAGQGAKLLGLKSPVEFAASMGEFIAAVNLKKTMDDQDADENPFLKSKAKKEAKNAAADTGTDDPKATTPST